jgi:GMP synthase-like glutamine amidotransferase
MKQIKIFRHIECEGPAYLETLLQQQNLPYEIIAIDQQQPVPQNLANTAGLIFMGGSMSVNDDHDWLGREDNLIKQAIQRDIPVMGVCLGSQLIAKALGAKVYPGEHGCMEIGWSPVNTVIKNDWTHDLPDSFDVFHWHGETFELPKNAVRLFSNPLYANQAFAYGPHLALQFHVEMTSDSIREWISLYTEDIERRCDRQQDSTLMLQNLDDRVMQLQQYARILFNRWLSFLVTG